MFPTSGSNKDSSKYSQSSAQFTDHITDFWSIAHFMESTKHEVSNYTNFPSLSCYFVSSGFRYSPHTLVPSSLALSHHSFITDAIGGITRLANSVEAIKPVATWHATGANCSYAKRPWPQQDISLRLSSRSVGAYQTHTNYEPASVQLFCLREQAAYSDMTWILISNNLYAVIF
jgi:hypothetical protein